MLLCLPFADALADVVSDLVSDVDAGRAASSVLSIELGQPALLLALGLFKDILDDPIDHSMVKCINEIGQVMGKRTVAEFVENDDIRAAVRELGVDYAQGYGIGRPRPFSVHQAQLRRVS